MDFDGIVAVGASASGLEALRLFISHVPPDTGAAFVIIQHLSPDFKSVMDQLLEKYTGMPVQIVEEKTVIEEDHIYLLAPKKEMHYLDGRLIPKEMDVEERVHPINAFFLSLSKGMQNRAIGIVLSGTGSDGTLGIKAIHEMGGFVLVQAPTEAQFDGMPLNAIGSDITDIIAPAKELAKRLVRYLKQPFIVDSSQFQQHLAEKGDVLNAIFKQLHEHTQIDFSDYKPSTVARRLEHRMGINGIVTLPFEIPDLKRSIEEVISTGSNVEVEVSSDQERTVQLKIHPYHTSKGRNEGSVVVFDEITDFCGEVCLLRKKSKSSSK